MEHDPDLLVAGLAPRLDEPRVRACPGRYCSPRHPMHIEPSFREVNDTLWRGDQCFRGGRTRAWCLLIHAEASLSRSLALSPSLSRGAGRNPGASLYTRKPSLSGDQYLPGRTASRACGRARRAGWPSPGTPSPPPRRRRTCAGRWGAAHTSVTPLDARPYRGARADTGVWIVDRRVGLSNRRLFLTEESPFGHRVWQGGEGKGRRGRGIWGGRGRRAEWDRGWEGEGEGELRVSRPARHGSGEGGAADRGFRESVFVVEFSHLKGCVVCRGRAASSGSTPVVRSLCRTSPRMTQQPGL